MYKRALQDSNEAIRIDPDMPICYYTRGIIHKNLGVMQKAAEDLQKCIDLTEDPELERAARAVLGTF